MNWLAAVPAETPLVSTNIQIILAFIITVLASVVVYLYRALWKERDARFSDLKDFQEQARAYAKEAAQKEEILYNKIEAARSGGR